MYCGSSALIGSSVAERMLGALAETEAEASWAAEAEVLELLVLNAGTIFVSGNLVVRSWKTTYHLRHRWLHYRLA